jgi:uncharacterized protein YdeI (YjbR/CyaY-like superfamily)
VHPATRAEWRAWLEANHATSPGIELVQWRPETGRARIAYDEIVEEALCFGWVDSTVRVLDDERSTLLVTPRKPGSTWARSNKERVRRLIAEGRMTDAGLRPVEAAKADGSWTFLDDVDAMVVPDDLAAALDADPRARRHFDAFPPSAKKQILYWVKTAKRPETRRRRIAEAVDAASRNVRARP